MYRFATVFCALLWAYFNRETAAQTATEHPYLEPSKTKSETCLNCHPDKAEGKFVHAAGAVSCESCHRSSSEHRRTTIAFKAEGSGLCLECHEIKSQAWTHNPYKSGQCLVCHNPHSSAFAGQARASVRTLCMSCHGEGSPDVQVDRAKQRVTLLGGRMVELSSYEKAQKVSGSHGEKIKPATAADASCLACHNAHGSESGRISLPGGRP